MRPRPRYFLPHPLFTVYFPWSATEFRFTIPDRTNYTAIAFFRVAQRNGSPVRMKKPLNPGV
jgi:hypothetical protein